MRTFLIAPSARVGGPFGGYRLGKDAAKCNVMLLRSVLRSGLWACLLLLLLMGCTKRTSILTLATPSPATSASPALRQDTNRTARFIVLLYHRFEDKPAELVTTPNDFRAQMQALGDNKISVISMRDLLAWLRGEKAIPSKSAVITIDDEWNSQYYLAWPILKEFGYPFSRSEIDS